MCNDKNVMAAAVAVATFEAGGVCLDYSLESIDRVDTRIEDFRQEGETSESMSATMTAFGFYVGEVIRRTLGRGEWVDDTQGCCLDLGGITVNPIGKCMKRLDNGASDSVRTLAEVSLLMANMPVEERENSLKDAVESDLAGVTLEVEPT